MYKGVTDSSLFILIMIPLLILLISDLNKGYASGLVLLFLVTIVNSVFVVLAAGAA